jgi:hypothetical protein
METPFSISTARLTVSMLSNSSVASSSATAFGSLSSGRPAEVVDDAFLQQGWRHASPFLRETAWFVRSARVGRCQSPSCCWSHGNPSNGNICFLMLLLSVSTPPKGSSKS